MNKIPVVTQMIVELRYTEDGQIDMKINHPVHGWIPFTFDENDKEMAFDIESLKNAISNHDVMPYVAPPPVQPPLHPDQKDIQDILDKL